MKIVSRLRFLAGSLLVAFFALVMTAGMAPAYYESDFEGLYASSGGEILTGQDGFYIPPGTDSVDWYAFTYAGNALGLPANPEGGDQFVGAIGPGSPTFARAQRDIIMDGSGVWTAKYDFACTYFGAPPSANNLGSFSLRSSDAANDFIHLFSWVDPNNPVAFNAYYLAYNAAGTQFSQPGESPGPEWSNLELNHWYRAWTKFDLATNRIVEVGIRDLDTGQEAVVAPSEWYLEGGAGGGVGNPISFRFFAGGSVPENVTAFDNTYITEMPMLGACCLADGTCIFTTMEECEGMGGVEYLPGTSCDPNPCVVIPVEQTTWGKIKARFQE